MVTSLAASNLAALWRSVVGVFMPPATESDPRSRRLYFGVIQSFLVISLLGLGMMVAYSLLHANATPAELLSILAGSAFPILGCICLRYTARLNETVILTNAGGAIAVFAFAALTGGIHSPGIPILFGLLIMAAGFGRAVITVVVFAMDTAIVAALFLLGEYGVLPPDRIPVEHQAVLRVLGILVMIVYSAVSLYILSDAWTKQRSRLAQALASAQDANAAKSLFLASMSHELRTPLNAIIGFSQFMKTETYGPIGHEKYVEYVGDVEQSGRHLLELVNEILDVSVLEINQAQLKEGPVDLATLAADSRKMLLERAQVADVVINIEIPNDLSWVFADETRVRQVILNLLGNAIKFSRAAGVISVTTSLVPDRGLSLEIKDQGLGIEKRDLERIQKPFVQIGGNEFDAKEGVGLGLFISSRLMEMHGGTLAIESAPGSGTTVTLNFPENRLINSPPAQQANLDFQPDC